MISTRIAEHLAELGFDALQTQLWARFASATIEALCQAEDMLNTPQRWGEYSACRGAFLKPKKYGKKRKAVSPPSEEGLTDALSQCLEHIRRSAPIGHVLRELDIVFFAESKLPSKITIGKHAKRTDIRACSYLSPNAPEIIFEAKLILDQGEIRERYLGADGLGRFIRKVEPYTRGPLSGMIAYTVEGDASVWSGSIKTQLHTPPPLAIACDEVKTRSVGRSFLYSKSDREDDELPPIFTMHIVMRFPVKQSIGPF